MEIYGIDCLTKKDAKDYSDEKQKGHPRKIIKTAMLYIAIAIENGRYSCSVPIMGRPEDQKLAEGVMLAAFRDLLGYDVRREGSWVIISWK